MKLNLNNSALKSVLGTHGKVAKSGKGFVLLNWITSHKIGATAIGLAAAVGATVVIGTAVRNTDIPEAQETVQPSYSSTVEDPKETKDTTFQFAETPDGTMKSDMPTEEQIIEKIAKEAGLNLVTPGYIREGANGESQAWLTEGDAIAAEAAGIADAPVGTEVTKTEGDYYTAPDGSVWLNEAAYNEFVAGNKRENTETTVEVEGNYYQAPDGSIWETKEDYDNYAASDNGTVITTITDGDTVGIEGNYYQAPDGSIWESQEEYTNFIKGTETIFNGVTETNDTITNNNNNSTIVSTPENIQKDQYGGYVGEDGYYHAADGYAYESINDYLAITNGTTSINYSDSYTNSYANSYNDVYTGSYTDSTSSSYTDSSYDAGTSYVENIQKDQYGGYVGEDGYYHAVDGYVYESINDYLATLEQSTSYTETAPAQTLEDSIPVSTEGEFSTVTGSGAEEGTTYKEDETYAETAGETTYKEDATYEEKTEEITYEETTEDIQYDEYGGYVGKDGFYHAKDGYVYVTLQDYLNTILYGAAEEENTAEKSM